MRVCDITRTDEVVQTVEIRFSEVDGADVIGAINLDLGKAASEALMAQDWSALAALVPAGLRKKDPKRSAGAKAAAATRKANRQAKAAPGGSEATGGGKGTATTTGTPTEAPGGYTEPLEVGAARQHDEEAGF